MPDSKPILVVAGTNRPDSNALRIANHLVSFYGLQGTPCALYSLTDLPPEAFGGNYKSDAPAVLDLQRRATDAAGLHVVTPEYNGSIPGVLKLWIDFLKFPDTFVNKPIAFVGEAAGQWGGLRAVEHLQSIFLYRAGRVFAPHVYLPSVGKLFETASGGIEDEGVLKRMREQCAGFAAVARKFERTE